MTILLETDALVIGYHHGRVAHRIGGPFSTSLRAGELVCLLGPNGAGKSTLMSTVAGVLPPLAGQVRLMGDDVARLSPRSRAQRMSIVTTERIAVGSLTGAALTALGRHPHTGWLGQLAETDYAIIGEALAQAGAEAFAARSVSELSDGERQKVLLARALAQQPQVLILDEITAFLDLPRRVEIMQTLRALARQRQIAVLLSTHDLDLALRSADVVWLLHTGGELRTGAPEDLVLDGTFANAFASYGITFDMAQGAFRVATSDGPTINVTGGGVPLRWTISALERAGYRAVTDGTGSRTVSAGSSVPGAWSIDAGASLGSLAEVLRALQ